MIIAQSYVHHRPDDYLVIDDHGAFDNTVHPEDGALTTQQLLGEFIELSATDMVRRIKQRAQPGDSAKICVYAETEA